MKSFICLTILFAIGSTSALEAPCTEPKLIGPCRGAIPRFYFDVATSTCKTFFFGGCYGNGNNFKSLQECQQTCTSLPFSTPSTRSAEPVNDACTQGKDAGPCRGAHPRFFFNQETGRCQFFLYGGCDGNANNFRSEEQCNAVCSPTAASPAPRSLPVNDVCQEDKKVGPCRGALPRFFFNKQSGECETFFYGGCEGNGNNFRTQQQCEATCRPTTPASAPVPAVRVLQVIEEDVCSQEAETGPCFGYFPRFAHNKGTGKCEEFIFGGCHGNGNNFKTVDECEAVCGNQVHVRDAEEEEKEKKDPAVVCAQPSDDGGCRAAFPMYFFNKGSNSCEEFIYGGCKGNDNRFFSKQECETFCKPVMQ